MKKSLIEIENKIKKAFSFKKGNPHTHWNSLLYIFFIITIILILFSLYLLYEIKIEQVFQIKTSSVESPSLMNEKLFNQITESFDNREVKQKEIKEDPNLYKEDPSFN